MIHEILPVGMLQCNCSIFGDETTRQAMVIDPGDEIGRILEVLARHRLTVTAIVITHAHIDHIGGAQKLKAATGAPVYMNLEDSELQDMLDVQAGWLGVRTPEAVEIDVPVKDGDKLLVGATEVHVLHTPGHTQGSICLWLPEERKLFAGDTLFRDGIGRTFTRQRTRTREGRIVMVGRLDGKVALITGAAGCQGRSHAVRLARDGADLIAVDICRQIDSVAYPLATPADLARTVSEVEALGRRIVAAEADVRDAAALRAAVASGVARLGSVDIVVAN